MKRPVFCVINLLVVGMFLLAACGSSAAPAAEEVLSLDNVCSHRGETIELEGKLVLPDSVSCSQEEPLQCAIYFQDPFREKIIQVAMPVDPNIDSPLLVNHMSILPKSYQTSDFYIRTANDRLVGHGSLVLVRGKVSAKLKNNAPQGEVNCSITDLESVTRLDKLLFTGLDLKRVTLDQALTEGLVVASITGHGLSKIDITLKPEVDVNMEIEVVPGTMFISGTGGVQNMVVRKQEFVYLKPSLEVSLELEASCANMELKQPSNSDRYSLSADPPNEELKRLFALDKFHFREEYIQQFAVWTITDNPFVFDFVGITVDNFTYHPDLFVESIRRLFEEAGIDTAKYHIFEK